jgi:hypothetical protein
MLGGPGDKSGNWVVTVVWDPIEESEGYFVCVRGERSKRKITSGCRTHTRKLGKVRKKGATRK